MRISSLDRRSVYLSQERTYVYSCYVTLHCKITNIFVHDCELKITLQQRMIKKKLHVIQGDKKEAIVDNTTCFSEQAKRNISCQRTRCKHWFDYSNGNNCVLISAQQGPHTLQKIGQIYGLTRMRICQIEKEIFEKIRKCDQ